MNLTGDLLDKYSREQVIAYLDKLASGILKNYQTAIKVNQPEVLFGNLGDIAQLRNILHEMRKRDEAREAINKS